MNKLMFLIALTGGILSAQTLTCSNTPQSAGPFIAVQNCTLSSGPYKKTDVMKPKYAFHPGSLVAIWVFEDTGNANFQIADASQSQWIQPEVAHQQLSCCPGTATTFLAFNVAGGLDTITVTSDKAFAFLMVMREYTHPAGIISTIDPTGLVVNAALTNTPAISLNTTTSGDLILTGNVWSDSQHPISFCDGMINHNMLPPPVPGGKLVVSDAYQSSAGPLTQCIHASNNGWAMWAVAIQPPGGGTPAGSIIASIGDGQSATINTDFTEQLGAVVKDSDGNPVLGAPVTFTAPGSGPTAAFSGGAATASVNTDVNGLATAPTLTANGTIGSYVVAASTAGVPTQASFNLTNTVVVSGGGGSLVGSFTSETVAASLTGEGGEDWIHWGDSSLNRKTGVAPQLSTYTKIGAGAVNSYNNDPRALSWSDGTPTANSSNNKDGVYINGIGRGFTFTALADTTPRTLTVHLGGYNSIGTFTAHLSDGSAADYVNVTAAPSGRYDRNFTANYQAASVGQQLVVTWQMTAGSGNVTMHGAALQ